VKRYYMVLAMVAVLLFGASTVFAAAPGWATSTVTYHLNGRCCDVTPVPDTYKNSVRYAANSWTNLTDIDFVESSSSANFIGFDDVTKWGAPSAAGAITMRYYNASNNMVKAYMLFNKNMTWATNGSASALDVENTAAHEFGHFGGLYDLNNPLDMAATMYINTSYGETYKRSLEIIDTSMMNSLY
jgi:hypothetical protein